MLNKLFANLPFNPSLVNQVAFYGRRLRAESSIRRLGFVFVGLALVVQVFAMISEPNLSQASPANDLINGGISSPTEAYSDCQQNSARVAPNYGTILNHYGIACSDISSAKTVSIKSTDDQNNFYSLGQQSSTLAGETPTTINGITYYWNYLWAWDANSTPSTYSALKLITANNATYYILLNSGNLVSIGLPTPSSTSNTSSSLTPTTNAANTSNVPITVTGTVYYFNGTGSAALTGVPVYNCYNNVTNEPSTDSHGQFSFNLPAGTPFCVRTAAPTVPYVWVAANGTIYSDPVITPNYIKPNPLPSRVNTSCTVVGYNNSSYEFQVAGTQNSPGQCNYDLSANEGYNIAFTKAAKPSAQTITISGNVYYFNGAGPVALRGVPIFNCFNNVTNEPSTDSNGHFSFSVPTGTGFCVRAGAPTVPYIWVAANGTTYSDPVITPDYIKPNSAPGKENTSCTVVGYNNSSYEFQVAASPVSPGQCNFKLATNAGYDIEFTKEATPSSPKPTTTTPTTTTTTPTTITPASPTTTPCEYNTALSSTSSQCKPCISSETQTDILSCLSYSKIASNLTENISNANGTTARAGDIIEYTLSVKNTATATAQDFIVQENLSDVLDYAGPQNLYGGTLNDYTNTLSWPSVNIPADATVQKTFTVKILNPIPTTLPSPSNPTYFNHTLTNTYGNTVVINLPISIVQASAQVSQSLPNTGPGSSLLIGGIVMVFIGYFLARSRLLAKESVLVASDFTVTGKA